MESARGRLHSLETLGALDGPGVRCVVFLQGCPLRCRYCHNPDTWAFDAGTEMTAEELTRRLLRYRPYFGREGGVTLSGGEPLAQPRFVREVLQRCKEQGIHTAVDTSGACLNDDVREALDYTDLILLDLKHADPARYHDLTGGSLEATLTFLREVAARQIPLWVRQVIVAGWTDTEQEVRDLVQLVAGVPSLQRLELLPYHTLGLGKWESLGIDYPLTGTRPPDQALLSRLEAVVQQELLHRRGNPSPLTGDRQGDVPQAASRA